MKRLLIFSCLMAGLLIVLNFKNYKKLPVVNDKFDMAKAEKSHNDYLKELEELAARQKPKPKVAVVEKEEGPLVVLSTPQLQSGSELYKKCIVCHGKRGEGKKSQNAPRIGGQLEGYIAEQITAMKNGTRINQKMLPYVKKLSGQDIKDLAAYISKIPWGK